MKEVSLKVTNYKCFGSEPQGFNKIKPLNIIIGRNNSGKSSLLDVINYAISPYDLVDHSHNKNHPQVIISAPLEGQELKKVFRPGTSGGTIGGNHWDFGSYWIGKRITFSLEPDGRKRFILLDPPLPEESNEFNQPIADNKTNPFSNKIFRHLKSERYILPEDDKEIIVSEYGIGATNIIQHYINKANLPSSLVEKKLLDELNNIIEPDSYFEDIVVQKLDDGKWEIFLEEKNKGRISLSNSGSGLQTVILILVNILLIPEYEDKPLNNYFFAFEEIENNLHPSLQRRLFQYLRKKALEEKTTFFITTHSNIVIDLFSIDPEAQIIHISHNGKNASTNQVKAYVDRKGILDDLDVRASDLLQSNGVIWVEGPSDRLYLNRWIEIFSDGELKEGAHYQCIFYGGRLLAHLTAENPEESTDALIKLLLINKNVIMLIDSDKGLKQTPLNKTKKRIIEEMMKINSLCWVTKGKEIENYIPADVLSPLYSKTSFKSVGQYEDFNQYLDKIKKNEGRKFLQNKVLFAEKFLPYFTKSNIAETLDLSERILDVCNRIKLWNALYNNCSRHT